MKTSIKLHPEMGEKVLERLSSLVDVNAVCTREGLIAGQAVASAVSELFGDGSAVVYNDVDVFRVLQADEKKGTKGRVLDTLNHKVVELYTDYGQLCTKLAYHYQVARTRRDELLNEVLCFGDGQEFLKGRTEALKFLGSFDLNCVQVGVDIATRQLVWTPAFEQFSTTRQLLVANIKTPVHTAIRWFRKKLELEGIFGNDETTMELLGAAIDRLNLEHVHWLADNSGGSSTGNAKLAGRLNFSTPYMERLADVAGALAPWLELVNQPSEKIELYTLKPRFKVPEHLLNQSIGDELLPTIARAHQGFWKKNICEQIIKAADATKGTLEHQHLRINGPGELLKQLSSNQLAYANNILNEHHLHGWTMHMSLSEKLEFVETLKALTKAQGLWVLGVMEHDQVSQDWEKLASSERANWLQEFAVRKAAEMAVAKTVPAILPELTLKSGFRLKELTLAMDIAEEGARMHHCVLGYFQAVSRGRRRIVSLRKHKVTECLTVEFAPQPLGWKAVQTKGVYNRDASPEELEAVRQAGVLLTAASWAQALPAGVRKFALTWLLNVPQAQAMVQAVSLCAKKLDRGVGPDSRLRRAQGKLKAVIDTFLYGGQSCYRINERGSAWSAQYSSWTACFLEWAIYSKLRVHGINPFMRDQELAQAKRALCSVNGFDDFDDDIPF